MTDPILVSVTVRRFVPPSKCSPELLLYLLKTEFLWKKLRITEKTGLEHCSARQTEIKNFSTLFSIERTQTILKKCFSLNLKKITTQCGFNFDYATLHFDLKKPVKKMITCNVNSTLIKKRCIHAQLRYTNQHSHYNFHRDNYKNIGGLLLYQLWLNYVTF